MASRLFHSLRTAKHRSQVFKQASLPWRIRRQSQEQEEMKSTRDLLQMRVVCIRRLDQRGGGVEGVVSVLPGHVQKSK